MNVYSIFYNYDIMYMVRLMRYIKDACYNEITIEKSRFITAIYPVNNIDEVNALLASTRKKYYDATHNCYAYILDNGNVSKASDDGEPSKTAGFPILDVLKKNDLTNVLCIVTRYFGGILLGASGLVRAYSSSCAEAVKKTTLLEKRSMTKLIIKLDYSSYNTIINKIDGIILDQSFLSDITLLIAVEESKVEDITSLIKSTTKGSGIITNAGIHEIFVPIY